MIRRDYHIKRYDWVIHVLYNVTCSRTSDIIALLRRVGCPESKIREAYGNIGVVQSGRGTYLFQLPAKGIRHGDRPDLVLQGVL